MYDSDDPIAVSGTLALHSFRLWPLRSIVAVTIAAFSLTFDSFIEDILVRSVSHAILLHVHFD